MTQDLTHDHYSSLMDALIKHRLIVCCGAGGVGKTTTSAALALAAARQGKRVLALTIDPSKRLAQTLGVKKNEPHPVLLCRDRLDQLGVPKTGELYAWLLDPQLISDQVVNAEAGDQAEALKKNLIYTQISGIVAGMQEYTAVEALHQFLNDQRFDLIILDTPPSRHALRFIDSPDRVASFLDKRIFRLFVPKRTGLIAKMAAKVIDEVLERAFGKVTSSELKQFFELFSRLLDHLNQNQKEMAQVFQAHDVAFYLVTTAREDAVDEAQRFAQEIKRRHLNLGGFLLNRYPLKIDQDIDLSELTECFEQVLKNTKNDTFNTTKSQEGLKALLHEPLLSTQKSHELRRKTERVLAGLGQVYRLKELKTDASTLEGIAQLTDQLMTSYAAKDDSSRTQNEEA